MEKKEFTPKEYYGFLREAISGQRVTPPLFESIAALGRDKTLERISASRSLFT
jgi:glutamyl-tRNA synthetase